jgi:hypothetical protein
VGNRTKFLCREFTLAAGAEEAEMKEPKYYRQYAADCLRIAKTMSAKDKQVLEQMAEAWEARARELEREKKNSDGKH